VRYPVIAIDGPAAAGKSTVARMVAASLGFLYVDTGAMYRALTLKALATKQDLNNSTALTKMASGTSLILSTKNSRYQVLLDGRDVSCEIRSETVSNASHSLASVLGVRNVLWDLQRKMRAAQPIVMEGRDIGSKVFPDAELKIFLTASVEERAKRRYKELQEKGENPVMEKILEDIRARDERDRKRDIAPLTQLPDAILIDTTEITPEEGVSRIVQLAKERNLL